MLYKGLAVVKWDNPSQKHPTGDSETKPKKN